MRKSGLIFSLLFCFILQGQKKEKNTLLDLTQLTSNFVYSLPFSIENVFDDRKDKSIIISKHKNKVVRLAKPLEEQLSYHFKTHYSTTSSKTYNIQLSFLYTPALLTIEKGVTRVAITFREPLKSKAEYGEKGFAVFYVETGAFNEEVRNPRDVNLKLKIALHKALVLFNEFLNQDKKFFQKEQVQKTTNSLLNKGLYLNHRSYQENHPYFDTDVTIKPKQKGWISNKIW